MNWKDIKKLIRKELHEATTVDAGGSKFNLRTGVNKNPTKLGVKLQFEPIPRHHRLNIQEYIKHFYLQRYILLYPKLLQHLGQEIIQFGIIAHHNQDHLDPQILSQDNLYYCQLLIQPYILI